MRFPLPLQPALLIRRYKRFLSDVVLEDGTEAVAHCPNPGTMMGLADEGMRIWLEPTPGKARKLDFAWRLVDLPGDHMAGIDTAVPNRIVKEALEAGAVAELTGYATHLSEQRYGTRNSRIDFLLTSDNRPPAYVEVKNCHLRRDGDLAEFPDCMTLRGAKHLDELADMAVSGARAVMLYVVQRTDCARFDLARDLDPGYATAFDRAREAGVEMLAYGTRIDRHGVWLADRMPVVA